MKRTIWLLLAVVGIAGCKREVAAPVETAAAPAPRQYPTNPDAQRIADLVPKDAVAPWSRDRCMLVEKALEEPLVGRRVTLRLPVEGPKARRRLGDGRADWLIDSTPVAVKVNGEDATVVATFSFEDGAEANAIVRSRATDLAAVELLPIAGTVKTVHVSGKGTPCILIGIEECVAAQLD